MCPAEERKEEREHLEELLSEMDRQEEAAADAEAMRESGYTEEEVRRQYNEEAATDRLSEMTREGDPQTREDIEKRLAELERADIADEIRKTEAGKTIQSTLDSLKERKHGEAPSQKHQSLLPVDQELADKVKTLSAGKHDVSNYEHSIAAQDLQHMRKDHSYITDDDVMLVPDITKTGRVKYEPSTRKGDRLAYTKRYGDRTYKVAERIGKKGDNDRLMFTTFYIEGHPTDDKRIKNRGPDGVSPSRGRHKCPSTPHPHYTTNPS